MNALLLLSRSIDRLNERVGRWVSWLVLAAVLISAGNAVVRKIFSMSSNAWLEIQWYLFAAVFLLAAGYTLLRQEHVRIDVLLSRLPRRTQVKVEIFGLLAFLLPVVYAVLRGVWPLFLSAWRTSEMSPTAGGLILWPVYLMAPLGFALLGLQGVSEVIKRVGFLLGRADDPGKRKVEKTAEEELAEAIRARAEGSRS